ncbi:MAG TPA: molybdate ABC transporter substrate-binding protein [Candidatus Limnocylindrales bacterium]|nr:molybdate ABC transporter substrate-binding protein [Candidatus Limnocylindrales bacterium]
MTARRRALAGLLAVGAVVAAGCAPRPADGAAPTEVIVFAAASLKAPLERAAATYEVAQPGLAIRLAFESSATLRTQIEQGAPADLFLSADLANPERVAAAGLGRGGVTPFAGNTVAIVVPSTNPAGIETAFDLARSGVAIVAAGPNVPITTYAEQLVERIGALPSAPAEFGAGYERNIVSREDNVRAVVVKLELGEGDAGIVYRTDATGSTTLRTIPLPDGVTVAVAYGGIVLAGSDRADDAAAFLAWLVDDEGQAILAESGFVPVP